MINYSLSYISIFRFILGGGFSMIRIITDSAADFQPQELAQLNITCIPLPVRFGDTEYQENVDLTKDR